MIAAPKHIHLHRRCTIGFVGKQAMVQSHRYLGCPSVIGALFHFTHSFISFIHSFFFRTYRYRGTGLAVVQSHRNRLPITEYWYLAIRVPVQGQPRLHSSHTASSFRSHSYLHTYGLRFRSHFHIATQTKNDIRNRVGMT